MTAPGTVPKAYPPPLKPLLFWISPTDVRCSSLADAVAAFVVIATMHVVAAWSVIPAVMPGNALTSYRTVAVLLLLQLVVVTGTLAVRWGLITYFAWTLGTWFGASTRSLLPYFGVVVMADGVTAAKMAVASVVARMSEAGARSYLQAPRMGLDLVFQPESPLATAILSSVDGFALWYGVIVVLGLRSACGLRGGHAILVVLCLAILSTAVRLIVPALIT